MASVVPLPQFHVEALTSTVTLFGDRVYKEVMKVKGGYKGGTLIR